MYPRRNDHSRPINLKRSISAILKQAFYPCLPLTSDIPPVCYRNKMHLSGLTGPAQHFIMEVDLTMFPESEAESVD